MMIGVHFVASIGALMTKQAFLYRLRTWSLSESVSPQLPPRQSLTLYGAFDWQHSTFPTIRSSARVEPNLSAVGGSIPTERKQRKRKKDEASCGFT